MGRRNGHSGAPDRYRHSIHQVVMPKGMSGLQLAYLARKLRPDLKVVIGTGYPLRTVREQYGRIDDFAFVNKPYRLAEPAKALRAAG
jgi:DNA-binding LytR/AlgR family response regulator